LSRCLPWGVYGGAQARASTTSFFILLGTSVERGPSWLCVCRCSSRERVGVNRVLWIA
jgi:hypothetical protein